LTGLNNSILDIRNTSSPVVDGESGIVTMIVANSSKLYFSGGWVSQLYIGGYTTTILSGGQIAEIWGSFLFPADASHIKVICQTNWTYQNGYLSGLWRDNSAFNIKLVTKSGSDIFSNMTIIPEPATMLLLAVGGLLIRRK
jgi:hypothetical protein